jgi:dienelactone hydrolase
MLVVAAAATLLCGTLIAQRPTPTPLLDSRGLPLPFGVQPYFKPDVPLGSGPYQAIMSEEPGLSAHVAYYPADLSKLAGRKLPVVIWGNGSCLYAGNRYRSFLTDVASHGYLAIAGGPMGAVEVEVGPQSNPAPRQGGAGRAAPQGAATTAPQSRVTVALLKEAVDWVVTQNGDSTSRFRNRLDLTHVVSMGHSCGGGLAVQLASEDVRINGLGIWFSGAGLAGARGADPASLLKIKGSVLLITGEEKLDVRGHQPPAHLLRLAGRLAAHRHLWRQERRRSRRARVELARLDDAQRSEGRENVQGQRVHALQGSHLARHEEENRLTRPDPPFLVRSLKF